MKHGSLFSGIGGFDLAAEWMGWTNVFHCEYNPFGQRVLKHYWPNAISYGDIKQTDFTIHRGEIDVLSGGFPCQPFSSAGKRKGTEDDRHLWPAMLRAIREIQPSYVVGENVRGFTNWNGGMVFDQVQADLEAQGYEVLPFLLPACAVNAPHRRDRIWIVAHSRSQRHNVSARRENNNQERSDGKEEQGNGHGVRAEISRRSGTTAHARLLGSKEHEKQATGAEQRDKADAPDTGSIESKRGLHTNGREQTERHTSSRSSRTIERGTWDNFPTQSPLCSRNDGLPTELDGITVSRHRKESIMAYGNAIVPQVAFELFKVIDNLHK